MVNHSLRDATICGLILRFSTVMEGRRRKEREVKEGGKREVLQCEGGKDEEGDRREGGREEGGGRKEGGGGKREEGGEGREQGGGKREEGRGRREEEGGKREEGRREEVGGGEEGARFHLNNTTVKCSYTLCCTQFHFFHSSFWERIIGDRGS